MSFKRVDYSSTISEINRMARGERPSAPQNRQSPQPPRQQTMSRKEEEYLSELEDKILNGDGDVEAPEEGDLSNMFDDYYRPNAYEMVIKQKQKNARDNSETATDGKGNSVGFRRRD